jgi:hypothetical protein
MTRALGTLPATDAARTIEEVADLVVYATQAFVTTGSALREGGLKPIVEYAADVRRYAQVGFSSLTLKLTRAASVDDFARNRGVQAWQTRR